MVTHSTLARDIHGKFEKAVQARNNHHRAVEGRVKVHYEQSQPTVTDSGQRGTK